MYELFGFRVFGVVFLVMVIVTYFGAVIVGLIFGHPAGRTYIEKTSRVVFELAGAQAAIWLVMFVMERMVPEQYFMACLAVVADLIALIGATLVVRASGFFAGLPLVFGHRTTPEQPTPGAQQPNDR